MEMEASTQVCSHPECSKPSTMQCPSCLKLGLEPSFFCSQDCFKEFWPIHKLSHKKTVKEEVGGVHAGYQWTGPLRPWPRSFEARREVPSEIKAPDYTKNRQGAPNLEFQRAKDKNPTIYDEEFLPKIRAACIIGRNALDAGHRIVAPGVTTEEIDKTIHDYIIGQGGYPSPLGYYNFPRSCCTSVNEVVCHGIPDTRPLQEGDIINVDVSVFKGGVHADLNETYCVG